MLTALAALQISTRHLAGLKSAKRSRRNVRAEIIAAPKAGDGLMRHVSRNGSLRGRLALGGDYDVLSSS